LKVTNFKKSYGDRFKVKSLGEIASRLDFLGRSGNGHHYHRKSTETDKDKNNFSDFDFTNGRRLYPDIQMPSIEFVLTQFVEHPYWDSQEVADAMRHRLDMRHYFPDRYKNEKLARGEIYYIDELEEYKPSILDAIELERLKRQRARRHKIGNSTMTGFDKENNEFHYQGTRDCDCCQPINSAEEHRAICEREKDI
jgi:hypothetical protein